MGSLANVINLFLVAAWAPTDQAQTVAEPEGLHQALQQLRKEEKFSGAVVVRGADGVRFARGYGYADIFEGLYFTPYTAVDSASLAKPITAAAVLSLVQAGKVRLDAPVRRYVSEFPHPSTTVRHLLSHSAGLDMRETPEDLAYKSNARMLADAQDPLFTPGTAFAYCNLCSVTLALLVERVTDQPFLHFAKSSVALPDSVRLRPQMLANWTGRAIGYRRDPQGLIEKFDSWDGELFYGSGNLSLSADALAEWGSRWWRRSLRPIAQMATAPARIGSNPSGLSLGNWYCDRSRKRCHYLGHHQGLHHMLYWDSDRKLSVAMVTNNALAPALQQRLQRALVAFAEGKPKSASRELEAPMSESVAATGVFKLGTGEQVENIDRGDRHFVRRRGIDYAAYPIGPGIRYVPGLDLYLGGAPGGRVHWLTLYEDDKGQPASPRN